MYDDINFLALSSNSDVMLVPKLKFSLHTVSLDKENSLMVAHVPNPSTFTLLLNECLTNVSG